ncbi:MAG: hypothetical protein JNK54_09935 [Elusimicrobia bacterium]|nr:hypothetical protein [Elusimicrobiota bacterium]
MKLTSSKYLPWLGLLFIFGILRSADGPFINDQNAVNLVSQSNPGGGPDFDYMDSYDTSVLIGLASRPELATETITHRLFVSDAAHRLLVYDIDKDTFGGRRATGTIVVSK